MILTEDQQSALDRLISWYKNKNKTPYITLGGYAGTGKTTLMGVLRKELENYKSGIRIAFCSYTGRAAQNLRNKLKQEKAYSVSDSISTIHSLIYNPIEDEEGRILGWDRMDDLEADLIIVDEASMVDGQIWQDLLSFQIPIIAVGDHGQLPPISGTFNLMESPDIKLSHIHRQAFDNPIIKISEIARNTGRIPPAVYGDDIVKYLNEDENSAEKANELLQNYKKDTLILCGYNNTRIRINRIIRESLGFESPEPSSGDRVICLRNNHKKAIFNGMLGTINEIYRADDKWYDATIKMDETGKIYNGFIYASQFGSATSLNYLGKGKRLAVFGDYFDFGYALTVHKAQGSQARKVVMFEERFSRMNDEMWRRWLYTGVTRAEEELYLFGN